MTWPTILRPAGEPEAALLPSLQEVVDESDGAEPDHEEEHEQSGRSRMLPPVNSARRSSRRRAEDEDDAAHGRRAALGVVARDRGRRARMNWPHCSRRNSRRKSGVRKSVKRREIAAAVSRDLTRTILPAGRRGTPSPRRSSTTSRAPCRRGAGPRADPRTPPPASAQVHGLAVPRSLRDRREVHPPRVRLRPRRAGSMFRRTASSPMRSCSSPADSPSSLIAPRTATVRSPGR